VAMERYGACGNLANVGVMHFYTGELGVSLRTFLSCQTTPSLGVGAKHNAKVLMDLGLKPSVGGASARTSTAALA
jgi:hypothetical protein